MVVVVIVVVVGRVVVVEVVVTVVELDAVVVEVVVEEEVVVAAAVVEVDVELVVVVGMPLLVTTLIAAISTMDSGIAAAMSPHRMLIRWVPSAMVRLSQALEYPRLSGAVIPRPA